MSSTDVGERLFCAIVKELENRPSKAKHTAIKPFAREVAEMAARVVASSEDARKEASEIWPSGWHKRNRAATSATITLAHSLERMAPREQEYWVPPAETVADFLGPEEGGTAINSLADLEAAVARWARLTLAIAKVLEMREQFPKARQRDYGTKSQRITFFVSQLAILWRKHFDEFPGASDDSPFTTVVQIYYGHRNAEGKVPSHPVIKDALQRYRATLGEEKKSGN
jgi:hypothetical protein